MHPVPLQRRLVLVVEDDPTVRLLECGLLESAGYSILQASNGEQALILAASSHPDLVVLDIGLPTISGLQVLHTLASESATSAIPVLIVSSYGDLIGREHSARAAGSITKPFEPSGFLGLVGQLAKGSCWGP